MILFEPRGLMIARHQPGYQADQRLRPSCTEGLQTRPTIMTIEGEPFCNCCNNNLRKNPRSSRKGSKTYF